MSQTIVLFPVRNEAPIFGKSKIFNALILTGPAGKEAHGTQEPQSPILSPATCSAVERMTSFDVSTNNPRRCLTIRVDDGLVRP